MPQDIGRGTRTSLFDSTHSRAYDSSRRQVKYPFLWRLGYTFTQPRIVHVPVQSVMGLIMGRQISEAFDRYQPDLVVSVHPLMQVSLSCCSSCGRPKLLPAET